MLGSGSIFLSLLGSSRRGSPMGQAASVETLHMPVSLCLGRKRRRLGQRKERNREMVEQQTDRQTSPGRDGSPAQTACGCRGGVYLVRNTSRAFLPQPQGWGHVFQHLKHVIVTDAPTGDPAHRTEAEWGPQEGSTGGVRQEGGGGSRQENRAS